KRGRLMGFRCRRSGVMSPGGNVLDGVARHVFGMIGNEQARMLDIAVSRLAIGDDDRRAKRGHGKQQFREFERQPYAAVARRVARKISGMQRNPPPREPLHVNKYTTVVDRAIGLL